jgi:hypothetical protein
MGEFAVHNAFGTVSSVAQSRPTCFGFFSDMFKRRQITSGPHPRTVRFDIRVDEAQGV